MEMLKELVEKHSFLLIDYYATWCEPCKMLDTILQEVANHFGEELKIIKIDVDKNQELVEAFGIKSVPILHLYKDGDLIWKYKGFMNVPDTIKLLETYLEMK
ncbi:MAG: thioredoxin family protein [Flavobacteriales bacterium]|jgi:thioredoxin 1|nr:thioredoxin family protein [Flavobacteriales bacterium]